MTWPTLKKTKTICKATKRKVKYVGHVQASQATGQQYQTQNHIKTTKERETQHHLIHALKVAAKGTKVYDETYETFLKKAKEDGKDLEDAFFTFYDRSEI